MSQSSRNDALALPFPPRAVEGFGRRVRNMVLLWFGLGALIGAGTTPPGGGVIQVVSFVLAGMIVMPGLGLALGLFGGGVKETCLGAILGGLLPGLATLAVQTENPLMLVNMGIIMGGTFGATLGTMFRLVSWLAQLPTVNPSARQESR